jgi:hypothetical protein
MKVVVITITAPQPHKYFDGERCAVRGVVG